jgi:hypothetical protein
MYRKDLITAEIEKLAQILAKIMGLKCELKLEESAILFSETLKQHFNLNSDLLNSEHEQDFINWLAAEKLDPQKLNALSDYLYSQLDFENEPLQSKQFAKRLIHVYRTLVDEHQIVHLINLGRQKLIEQHLN